MPCVEETPRGKPILETTIRATTSEESGDVIVRIRFAFLHELEGETVSQVQVVLVRNREIPATITSRSDDRRVTMQYWRFEI
jgi:hypothetical protein